MSPSASLRGGAPYEIALCLPGPTAWAPRMLAQLAQLAQLSVGYELTHINRWTWTNLTKCAASMGASISIPRALREPYDGFGFVAYRVAAAPSDAPRVRLTVGVEAHEHGLTEAKFVGALKRYGFWPVTPATRDNVVDLAERYVPRPAATPKQKPAPEADDARALVEWLVEIGELVVADGAIARVVDPSELATPTSSVAMRRTTSRRQQASYSRHSSAIQMSRRSSSASPRGASSSIGSRTQSRVN